MVTFIDFESSLSNFFPKSSSLSTSKKSMSLKEENSSIKQSTTITDKTTPPISSQSIFIPF